MKQMNNKNYINEFYEKENYFELHIYGLKHEATLLIEKSDFKLISSVNWGLMAVGRKQNSKIIPYTTLNRKSIPLGRWLLDISDSDKKVEHKDGDNHNFLRANLYVNDKNGLKMKTKNINDSEVPAGIFPVTIKNDLRGYIVHFRNIETNKKTSKYFSRQKYSDINLALLEACNFRNQLMVAN